MVLHCCQSDYSTNAALSTKYQISCTVLGQQRKQQASSPTPIGGALCTQTGSLTAPMPLIQELLEHLSPAEPCQQTA